MPPSVLPWPFYRENPYLARLCGELRGHGLRVRRRLFLGPGSLCLRRGDWIHFHWPGARVLHGRRAIYEWRLRLFLAELRWFRRRGLRMAWTAHNLLPHDDPHPDLALAARRALLAAVEHVFVHFDDAARSLAAELGSRVPVTVVPHGHYIDDYPAPPARAEARRALGLPPRGRVLLAFGGLRPYKNLDAILAGFRAGARADDRLILAGRPEGGLAEVADPRVLRETRFIPPADVPRCFAAADALLLAHRAFFTSGSAVLALSMGCPVLGPPIHHLASLPGVLPMEPTAEGIAAALRDLEPLADGARADLRDWARAHLSWRDAGARTAAVLLGRGA